MKELLDFIAAHESRGDYNVVWGGIKRADRPKKPLVQMTIAEVLAWQESIDAKYQSEAAGRYQIMEDTLRTLYKEAGMSPDDLFDEAGQDRLAVQLLKRRGLDKYLSGKMTAEAFCIELAKEWASLPCVSGPRKGRSYYAGDGLNKAGVDVEPFLNAVRAIAAPVANIPKPQRKSITQSRTAQASAASLMGGVGVVGTAASQIGALSETAQVLLIGFGIVCAVAAVIIFRERLRKWAEGVR